LLKPPEEHTVNICGIRIWYLEEIDVADPLNVIMFG